jgi:nitroreductase
MAQICLGQRWLESAALHFVFMADLAEMESVGSSRGYRLAMLGAGRLGQALYLGATAVGLGCCGIGAFFDDEAADLLGLKATAYMLYLVATGPVKRL